jgi:hypothetical protein
MLFLVRNIAAVVTGAVGAFATVAASEFVNHRVFPMPAHLDVDDPAALATFIEALPMSAFVLVALGWLLSVTIGTLLASLVGRARPNVFAMVVGGMVLLAAGANFVLVPHPTWFIAVGVLAILLGAVLGAKLAGRSANK